jgi:hypothetical protein
LHVDEYDAELVIGDLAVIGEARNAPRTLARTGARPT